MIRKGGAKKAAVKKGTIISKKRDGKGDKEDDVLGLSKIKTLK